jgi:hypothetical protein
MKTEKKDTISTVKNYGTETIKRLNSETSPYFKPFKYAGGAMLIAGVGIEIAALFTPAMPIAIIGLSSKLLTIGGILFTGSALTQNKDAKAPEKITLFGTLKNILFK